ncbi:intraflagellar transport-associated protein [Choloepus didactylus]|uniref:intraflagellar transport-associated protein n=1 Tax=Choloepus didactylus TaxID=27675 RepID=UPI00189EA993|nr:intraflagellar transport-associated protein [Choloepus didactylus]XP_037697206.1 intraflagellar transport-associated protein [Choloepus didactylus]
MPAQISGLEIMDEDWLIEEVLDKFVNCHEQTYEEFLSTFTYISKDNVTRRRTFEPDSSENILTLMKVHNRSEPNDYHLGNKTTLLCTSSQCSEEEQIVMDEGQKVGSFVQGDLNRAGKVKVDNFLDLEDLDMDEEIKAHVGQDLLLLPGEVEQDVSTSVPSYFPSVDRLLACEGKPRPTVKGANRQMEEMLRDEVQPFSLDEEFDYDNVMLTPKFTPAEMDTVRELANTDFEEPHD